MKFGFAACACLVLAAVGCQVINSFDEVKQGVDEGGSGAGAIGGTGGATGGTGGDAGAAGGGGTGGDGGSTGGTGATGGAGGDGGVNRDGLVVVSGPDVTRPAADPGWWLATIDPRTGTEIAREQLAQPIRAIAYDAVRDLWFLFQRHDSGDLYDPATLKVGRFNLGTGKFEQTGSDIQIPSPESQGAIGVLRERILYKSTLAPVGTTIPTGLTLLDTTDSAAVRVRGQQQSQLPAAGAIGMIARPATVGAGGTLTLVQTISPCGPHPIWDGGTAPEVCEVQLENALVAATADAPTFPVSRRIGFVAKTGGSPGWTSSSTTLLPILPPPVADPLIDSTGQVLRLRPDNLQQQDPPISFDLGGPRISHAAYDRCLEVVLATELLTAQAIFVIPTAANGTVHRAPSPNSAQRVIFEPYTRTVIRPFADNANPELAAYVLGGTKTAPTLTPRPTGNLPWSPAADIKPDVVVARDPGNVACPP